MRENIYKQKLMKIFDIQKGRGFYEETKKAGTLAICLGLNSSAVVFAKK